jgi:arylformamidase
VSEQRDADAPSPPASSPPGMDDVRDRVGYGGATSTVVEGLDLRPVQAGNYDLIVLPLKVRGHEGAPARAIMRRAP